VKESASRFRVVSMVLGGDGNSENAKRERETWNMRFLPQSAPRLSQAAHGSRG
jgi:hypothetical protein